MSSFIILIHELPHLQLRGRLGGTPRIDLHRHHRHHTLVFSEFSGQWMQSIAMSEFWQLNLVSCQHPSDEPVLPCCRVLCHSKLVLLDDCWMFTNGLPTVPCHASMVQLREPHVKSVESDQVPVPLTDNHAGTAYVPSSMYLPKAA